RNRRSVCSSHPARWAAQSRRRRRCLLPPRSRTDLPMSRVALLLPARKIATPSGRLFAAVSLSLAVLAALLAGWAPLGFSIVTVFLFAGPHNWIEARYFLARMPARWGRLRNFFLLAFAGIFGLTLAFAALPWLTEALDWSEATWQIGVATW